MFGRRKSEDVGVDAPEVVAGEQEMTEGATEVIVPDQVMANARRKRRLTRILVSVLVLCIACGAGLFAFANNELTNATVRATRSLEYARAFDEDLSEVVTCSSDHVGIEVQGDIDITAVGTQSLPVRLTLGPLARTDTVEIEVVDTCPPDISLKEQSVTIELGDGLEVSDIVAEVTDPVDGELAAVTSEPKAGDGETGHADVYDKGFYLIEGTDDLAKAGDHEVRVVATDVHGNRSEKRVSVTVTDPLEGVELKKKTDVLEYAKKKVDPATLVSCDVDGVKITATDIDLSKVGKTKVTYTLTKGASTRKKEFEFEVRDTKKPTIELAKDSAEIKEGDSFDPYSLVKSVRDEVDGELARKGKQGEGEGFYAVDGTVDTAKPGKYFLTVVAEDRNGNKTEKEVAVKVAAVEKPRQTSGGSSGASTGTTTTTSVPAPAAPTSPASSAADYVLNTNTYKFHYPTCRYVNTIYDENREDVHMTREEIIARGFVPCKHCDP